MNPAMRDSAREAMGQLSTIQIHAPAVLDQEPCGLPGRGDERAEKAERQAVSGNAAYRHIVYSLN